MLLLTDVIAAVDSRLLCQTVLTLSCQYERH